MNYFFKFLVPQLLEYFDNDKEKLLEFIPKIALENYKNDVKTEQSLLRFYKNNDLCK